MNHIRHRNEIPERGRRLGGLALFTAALAALLAAPSPGPAQTGSGELTNPEVTVVLEGRQRPRFRLAFPEPPGLGALPADAGRAARELDAALRADLEYSKVVDIQGPAQLAVLTLSGDPTRDFEQYRSLGNELLLDARIIAEPGNVVLEARLFDLESGKEIMGKRYRAPYDSARRVAHTLADALVEALSGRPGIALTTIAYTADAIGDGQIKEIFLMDYDGWNPRPITAHKTLSMSPSWSPAGDAIVYTSYFAGLPGLYLADVRTGRKSPVVTEGTLNILPSFSPDGRQIVFSRSLGDGNTEIFICNRDGSDMRRLTHSSGIDTNPAWSPTGREIAFTSSRGGGPQIYIMDAEGANLQRVSFGGDYNDGAAWSPDGTRIAYSTRSGSGFDLVLADVVTNETRTLTSGTGSNETPSFSPDGRRLVFASTRTGSNQIFAVDIDGANLRQLTRSGRNTAPDWSGYPPE